MRAPRRTVVLGALGAEQRRGELRGRRAASQREREPRAERRVEPAIDLFREELVERLREDVRRRLASGTIARETDDGGPAARERDEPERSSACAPSRTSSTSSALIASTVWGISSTSPYEDVPGRRPTTGARGSRSGSAREQLDERLDEPLRRDGRGEVVVVVDHDQAVVGPAPRSSASISASRISFALGILRDRRAARAADDRLRRRRSTPHAPASARRTATSAADGSGAEPAHDAGRPAEPTARQDRLPVPRAGDERSDARRRPVEGADQPRALDDPAPADRSASVARLPSGRAERYSSAARSGEVAPAAGVGGPRAPAVSGSVGDGA